MLEHGVKFFQMANGMVFKCQWKRPGLSIRQSEDSLCLFLVAWLSCFSRNVKRKLSSLNESRQTNALLHRRAFVLRESKGILRWREKWEWCWLFSSRSSLSIAALATYCRLYEKFTRYNLDMRFITAPRCTTNKCCWMCYLRAPVRGGGRNRRCQLVLNLEVALMDPWMEQSYLKMVRCAGMYLRDG